MNGHCQEEIIQSHLDLMKEEKERECYCYLLTDGGILIC